jgi:hypothetical protein
MLDTGEVLATNPASQSSDASVNFTTMTAMNESVMIPERWCKERQSTEIIPHDS